MFESNVLCRLHHHQALLLRHMSRGAIHYADMPPGPTPLITGAGERVTITAFPHEVTLYSLSPPSLPSLMRCHHSNRCSQDIFDLKSHSTDNVGQQDLDYETQ